MGFYRVDGCGIRILIEFAGGRLKNPMNTGFSDIHLFFCEYNLWSSEEIIYPRKFQSVGRTTHGIKVGNAWRRHLFLNSLLPSDFKFGISSLLNRRRQKFLFVLSLDAYTLTWSHLFYYETT
jgi:hypothetical protein